MNSFIFIVLLMNKEAKINFINKIFYYLLFI